jgi:hypothetical protein
MPVRSIKHLLALMTLLISLSIGTVHAQNAPTPVTVTNDQIATMSVAAAQKMRYYAIWLADIVGPHADSVFLAIIWYVVVAKIALMAFKIMAGGNLVEELVHFLSASILLLLLFYQIPQGAVARLKDSFEPAGRLIGVTLVEGTKLVRDKINDSTGALPEQITASGVKNVEPLSYWLDWIGDPTKTATFKYDGNYIAQVIFRSNLTQAGIDQQGAAGMGEITRNNQAANPTGTTTPLLTGSVQSIGDLITSLSPFMIFNYALITAQTQLAGYAAVTFSQLAILFGAHIGFALLYSFGLSLMPLIFFKSYFNLWAHYLTTLIAFALVPGFYYIFAAVGYGFATTTFQILFLNTSAPLGAYLWQAFDGAFEQAANSFKGGFGMAGGAAKAAFALLKIVVESGVMHLIGAGLITAFLAMGAAFAALAPAVASKWNSGFIDMGILDTTNNTIRTIESSLGSMMGQGMAMGARGIAGVTRGVTGGIFSMMGR